jgi:hypothetical protein
MNTTNYTKVILKDKHLIDGKIIPKGYIILIKKNIENNKETNK